MIQVADGRRVFEAKRLTEPVRGTPGGAPVDGGRVDRHQFASSAHTVMERNAAGPNVVSIATSSPSRPRPIRTRPTRRALVRGSNAHPRPPSYTSIHSA